jgi:hypothetical protein
METISDSMRPVPGIGADELSPWLLLARCVVIHILGIALVCLGNERFRRKTTISA